jgi:hypothetical protein
MDLTPNSVLLLVNLNGLGTYGCHILSSNVSFLAVRGFSEPQLLASFLGSYDSIRLCVLSDFKILYDLRRPPSIRRLRR